MTRSNILFREPMLFERGFNSDVSPLRRDARSSEDLV